ncbi:kanadaptin [Bacillus rossius redtenbacheri]|uniref:kanadaptin n=1 Tax=Bacillus rossius redtenbacheri TaxID=93214 RepID=UPI002FDCE146
MEADVGDGGSASKGIVEKNEETEGDCESKMTVVFRKPVFIGPRRGKSAGKLKGGKNADNTLSQSTKDSENTVENNLSAQLNSTSETTNQKKSDKLSPAQKITEQVVPLPYKEPKWSGLPKAYYKFEVLKCGKIIETLELISKPFFVFGKLSSCDVILAHPTISRYHAVLQFRKEKDDENQVGFYVYDLNSTHGTFVNKYRIIPNKYVRLQVGHLLKFGCSSRMFILHGPEEDAEPESDLSFTELRRRRALEQAAARAEPLPRPEPEPDGIDWGLGEDADEETDLTENPFAATNNEDLFIDDPKKALRGWFEREGYDLEYHVEEKGFGQFLCRVELPVDTAANGIMRAEVIHKGKKKEAVVQCALEACRILDRHGLLRQATHESRRRKVKNWEDNDFYDSDEDTFFDRTGVVEKKRSRRMQAAGKDVVEVETYDSLSKKRTDLVAKLDSIEKMLSSASKPPAAEDEDDDPLDKYITTMCVAAINQKELKRKLKSLKAEEKRLRSLLEIAKPTNVTLPSSSGSTS